MALAWSAIPSSAKAQQTPTDHSQHSAAEHAKQKAREKAQQKKKPAKKKGHEGHSRRETTPSGHAQHGNQQMPDMMRTG